MDQDHSHSSKRDSVKRSPMKEHKPAMDQNNHASSSSKQNKRFDSSSKQNNQAISPAKRKRQLNFLSRQNNKSNSLFGGMKQKLSSKQNNKADYRQKENHNSNTFSRNLNHSNPSAYEMQFPRRTKVLDKKDNEPQQKSLISPKHMAEQQQQRVDEGLRLYYSHKKKLQIENHYKKKKPREDLRYRLGQFDHNYFPVKYFVIFCLIVLYGYVLPCNEASEVLVVDHVQGPNSSDVAQSSNQGLQQQNENEIKEKERIDQQKKEQKRKEKQRLQQEKREKQRKKKQRMQQQKRQKQRQQQEIIQRERKQEEEYRRQQQRKQQRRKQLRRRYKKVKRQPALTLAQIERRQYPNREDPYPMKLRMELEMIWLRSSPPMLRFKDEVRYLEHEAAIAHAAFINMVREQQQALFNNDYLWESNGTYMTVGTHTNPQTNPPTFNRNFFAFKINQVFILLPNDIADGTIIQLMGIRVANCKDYCREMEQGERLLLKRFTVTPSQEERRQEAVEIRYECYEDDNRICGEEYVGMFIKFSNQLRIKGLTVNSIIFEPETEPQKPSQSQLNTLY